MSDKIFNGIDEKNNEIHQLFDISGNELRFIRKFAGMNMRELAEAIQKSTGVQYDPRTMWDWEQADRLSQRCVLLIVNAIGMEIFKKARNIWDEYDGSKKELFTLLKGKNKRYKRKKKSFPKAYPLRFSNNGVQKETPPHWTKSYRDSTNNRSNNKKRRP